MTKGFWRRGTVILTVLCQDAYIKKGNKRSWLICGSQAGTLWVDEVLWTSLWAVQKSVDQRNERVHFLKEESSEDYCAVNWLGELRRLPCISRPKSARYLQTGHCWCSQKLPWHNQWLPFSHGSSVKPPLWLPEVTVASHICPEC